jgi:hypothetical protein
VFERTDELITLNPHPGVRAASLQFGEMTGHDQWFPGGAYRLAMAEIYLGTLANSKRGDRASKIIGSLRSNEAWGSQWNQLDANAIGDDVRTHHAMMQANPHCRMIALA